MTLHNLPVISPKESQKVFLTIELADGVSIQVRGRVAWEKPEGNDFLVGIRFEEISQKVQDMIFNCAFECEKEQFQARWFDGV